MRLRAAICAGIIAAMGIGTAVAHDHEHSSKKKNNHHEDNGRHLAKGHHKFDDRDREITQTWCRQHRDRLPVGFRDVDRLPPQLDARLQVGIVLDLDLRKQIHPLPTDLLRQLPAPPTGVQYIAIGGHVGLVDAAHRLHDLLPRPPLPF
jgi:hypothetical protein